MTVTIKIILFINTSLHSCLWNALYTAERCKSDQWQIHVTTDLPIQASFYNNFPQNSTFHNASHMYRKLQVAQTCFNFKVL